MPSASTAPRRRPKPVGLVDLSRQAICQGLCQITAAARETSPRTGRLGLDLPGRLLVGTGGDATQQQAWLTELAQCWRESITERGTVGADSRVGEPARPERLSRCDGRQLAKELRRCRGDGSLEPLRKLLVYGCNPERARARAPRHGRPPQPAGPLPAIVLLDRIDRAAGREDNQLLLCQLIDAVLQTPTLLAVTLPRHPARLTLHPLLESRLTGGLVLPLGPDAAAWSPQPAASTGHGTRTRPTPQERSPQPPTVRRIIAAVARYYAITAADILGGSQRRCHVRPRGLAIHLLRRLTGKSTHAIGQVCGGRDHTTVLHSLKVTTRLLQTDPTLAGDLETILTGLQ